MVRLRRREGERLYCVKTDMGERYARDKDQAILKTTANLLSVEEIHEVDDSKILKIIS